MLERFYNKNANTEELMNVDVILDGVNEQGKKDLETVLRKIFKKADENNEKNINQQKKINDAIDKNTKKIENTTNTFKDAVDEIKKGSKKYDDARAEAKKQFEEEKRFNVEHLNKWARLADYTIKVLDRVATEVYNNSKNRLNWLLDLESAGYRFADGIDNSFHQLSQSAKLTHDDFGNLIRTNSRDFTKLNALNKNAIYSMMNASGNIVGKFGYTADSASNVMMHYMKTIALTGTEEQLRSRNITAEVEKLAKELRQLSHATGKSTEQLIKEREEREDTLFALKISKDPRLAGIQNALKDILTPGQIKGILSGVPNEETSLMGITSVGRRLMRELPIAIQRGADSNEIIKIVDSIQRSPEAISTLHEIDRMNLGMAYHLNDEDIGKVYNSAHKFITSRFNTSTTVGTGNVDETAVNNFADFKASVDKLRNQSAENLTLSASTSAKALTYFTDALNFGTSALKWGGPVLSIGLKTLSGAFSVLATYLTGKFIMNVLGNISNSSFSLANVLRHMTTSLRSFTTNVLSFSKSFALGTMKIAAPLIVGGLAGDWVGGWAAKKYATTKTEGALVGGAAGLGAGALAGAALGGLFGLLGGPLGVAVGSKIGALVGGAIIGGTAGAVMGGVSGYNAHEPKNTPSPAENIPESVSSYNANYIDSNMMMSYVERISINTRDTANRLYDMLREIKMNGIQKYSAV